jgi:AraC-like DNA-binding protein
MNKFPTLSASRPSDTSVAGMVKEPLLINYLPPGGSALQREIYKAGKGWQEIRGRSRRKNNRKCLQAASFLELVEAHFWHQRHVLYYAAGVNVSKDYLREICREALYCCPKRCIEMRIVLEGLCLLRNPMLDVGEISFQLGYKNASQFIKIFKGHTGWTPGALRLAG